MADRIVDCQVKLTHSRFESIKVYISEGLLEFVLQSSFFLASIFRLASVLEGTGKGVDYEEGK